MKQSELAQNSLLTLFNLLNSDVFCQTDNINFAGLTIKNKKWTEFHALMNHEEIN